MKPLRSVCLLLCPVIIATACDPSLESPVDDRPLADALNLLHVRDVIDRPELTVGELIEQAKDITFRAAPDPTALLEEMNTLDDDRPDTGGTSLRILTQNAGLLDANIFWFIPYAQTPYLDERRPGVFDDFLSDDPDVVFLQEMWVQEDVDRFRTAAEAEGYFVSVGSRSGYNDGLMMLVRESFLDGATVEEGAQDYNVQDVTEWFPGPGLARGYQWVRFEHSTLGEILLFNTHMAPFPERWDQRMQHARQIGIAVSELASDDALVFLGGDMNAGPYYPDDVWQTPDGEIGEWWQNATMWPLLMEYGDLTDLAIMGRPASDALADIVQMDSVVNDPEAAVTTPGAAEGWCDDTPDLTLTGSDCNSLYFEQYAGTEYPARLDHVMVRDRDGRVRATSSRLTNTEQAEFDGVTVEPSDHYGVVVDVVIDGT